MKKHWLYLKYVLRHKWFVLQECWAYGLYWQGITHDWHKFLPDEWFAYVEFFYGKSSKTEVPYRERMRLGEGKAFQRAWLKHQHRAKHHWQNWIIINDTDDPQIHCLDMPPKQVIEMICDWNGAGKAIMGKDGGAIPWYQKHKEKMMLSEKTETWIETTLHFQLARKSDSKNR